MFNRVKCIAFFWESSVFHINLNGVSYSYRYFSFKGEQKNGLFSNVYDAGSTIEWTESMERCFVDFMVEQVNNGNRIENLFNEEAWMHVAQTFNTRWGLQSDKKVLMEQYLCLMKKHDDICNILSHSEFAWNETLQTIIAKDDVWDAYIKVWSSPLTAFFVWYHLAF